MSRPGRHPSGAAGLLAAALVGVFVAGCSSSAGAVPTPARSTPVRSTATPAWSPGGAAGSGSAGDQTYGSLPSWLPTAAVPVGRVVTASAEHPGLGIEGDTMAVDLPAGRVVVTVVGPSVPEEGRFPIPASTRCTFTVTMSAATAAVPIVAGQWTATDERSLDHHLRAVSLTGGPAPRAAGAGSTVRFRLVTDLPPGSGALSWAPVRAAQVGTWEFDVEID